MAKYVVGEVGVAAANLAHECPRLAALSKRDDRRTPIPEAKVWASAAKADGKS